MSERNRQAPTFRVRPATRDDIAFLTRCAEEAYTQYIEAIGKRPAPMDFDFAGRLNHDTIEVLIADGRRAGYVVWRFKPDCLFLDSIAIGNEWQGKGLARQAFDHLERVARASRREAIELYTNEAMVANLTLYPHLGFERTGVRNEDGFTRVYFRKALS